MEKIEWMNPWDHQTKRIVGVGGAYPCLNANSGGGGRTDGVVYAIEGKGAATSHGGAGYSESGKSYTLNTIEQHAVCYAVDCRNSEINRETSGTLQAHNNGGWSVNSTNPVMYEKRENDEGISDRPKPNGREVHNEP